jgi:hypothetical protein
MEAKYWHEFILDNNVEYTEIIQNDLLNYYSDYHCIPFKLYNGTVEFRMRGEDIRVRATRLKSDVIEEGELRIYLRQVGKDWDIVIKQGERNIIVGRNFKQAFLSNLEIEVLFK